MCDLWIRSQDKRKLFKIKELELSLVEPCHIVADGTSMGKYKTKERAMEVLDEIQKSLSTVIISAPQDNYTSKDLKRAREYGILSNPSETILDTGCVIYQMPEE